MNITKYIPSATRDDEEKVSKFLKNYPPLDEYELIQMAIKELPTTSITGLFYRLISQNWHILKKTNLVCFDISIELEKQGFYGARVDKYLLGLILNYCYKEHLNLNDIKTIVDRISNYLKGDDRTFRKFVDTLLNSKLAQKLNIPVESLQAKASKDIEEFEQIVAQIERLKTYDTTAMENL